jgi:hypothetical protein
MDLLHSRTPHSGRDMAVLLDLQCRSVSMCLLFPKRKQVCKAEKEEKIIAIIQ